MTKLRDPLSFSDAITRIGNRIGWDEVARLTGRAARTVRYWSESDEGGNPRLNQAFALDRAYQATGGQGAPILESYARQFDVALTKSFACKIALAEDIAATARENADAISCSIAVTQPGASLAAIHRAIQESEEAIAALTRLLARLKSFLPGNGATQAKSGEN